MGISALGSGEPSASMRASLRQRCGYCAASVMLMKPPIECPTKSNDSARKKSPISSRSRTWLSQPYVPGGVISLWPRPRRSMVTMW